MKKLIQIIIYSYLLMSICLKGYSQATQAGSGVAGHAAGGIVANYYLGWDNSTTIPLEIRHDATGAGALDIDFYTNGSQKMTIKGTNSTDDGFVGIGTASPKNLLHTHAGSLQITNSTTGSGNSTDGLLIGQATGGSSTVEINNQENSDMKFLTGGTSRISIDHSTGGYVAIGTSFTAPTSRLHARENGASTDTWFQLTSNSTGHSSGNGLRIGVLDATKNVEIRQQANADMLFYTSTGGVTSERARILSTGNVGIATNGPDRKFEVFDGGGDPQMRLTYSDNSIYSDLRTTYAGHLYLHPVASGGAEGNVGIGLSNPSARLHVNTAVTANSSFEGTKIDLSHTVSTVGYNDIALNVTSTTTSGGANWGVKSSVNGSGSCVGYYADINNSNTASSDNYGYVANITDNGATTNTGVSVGITNTPSATTNKGYVCQMGTGSLSTSTMYGMVIANQNAANNRGILINCTKSSTSTATGDLYGIDATTGVSNGATVTNSFGGHFIAGGGTSQNYGVYASGGTNCSSGGGCTDAAGYFSGKVFTTNGPYESSDQFLKDNISPINNALMVISQLNPKTYTFRTQDYPSMHLPEGTHYGLIADEVLPVLPDVVDQFSEPEVKDDLGNVVYSKIDFKAIHYTELISVLVAGMKEQQAQIADLQSQITGCCNLRTTDSAPNTGSLDLENVNTLQLLNADPNPFSESTMIRWNIPTDYANAVIYFYDNSGNKIDTYTVNSKGAGELQIFGSSLSSGIYTYSLVVDGKVVDSKKLVKTK
ncbi:MAG: tail fiber domain-containing protein [Ferruginibacter sp.]